MSSAEVNMGKVCTWVRAKFKRICFVMGFTFFIISFGVAYKCYQEYQAVRPAEAYTDLGVFTFKPYKVQQYQGTKRTQITGRHSIENTTTNYRLLYRSIDGGKYRYQWRQDILSREYGLRQIEEKNLVQRRVLEITKESDKGTYITIDPAETATSYTDKRRFRNKLGIIISVGYALTYGTWWLTYFYRRLQQRREERQQANQ